MNVKWEKIYDIENLKTNGILCRNNFKCLKMVIKTININFITCYIYWTTLNYKVFCSIQLCYFFTAKW